MRSALPWLVAHIVDGRPISVPCRISVPPAIPAAVSFRVDYQSGIVQVVLVNVDRLERVTLEFHSNAIEEPVLEDLVRLMLGRDSAFLRRAPLAGLHARPPAAA